jgi:hypothetical protein
VEEGIEHTPGSTYKRFAFLGFVQARGFTKEAKFRSEGAVAWDKAFADIIQGTTNTFVRLHNMVHVGRDT